MKRWLLDSAERTARTFVQGLLGVMTMDYVLSADLSWGEKFLGAAFAGVYAVLSAFAAKPVGANDSASFLPAELDPPA